MVSFFGGQGKKTFEVIVGAVAHSTNCDRAILFVKYKKKWMLLATHGICEGVKIDDVTIGFLELFYSCEESEKRAASDNEEMISLNKYLQIGKFAHAMKIFDATMVVSGVLIFGSTKHCDELNSAQKYALKTHAMMLGALIDLRKKSITEGLSSKEDRLRLLESVVVNANDAILITEAEPIDEPGPKIVYCNPAFEAITGFNQKDILGLTPRILQCAETQRYALDLIRESLSQWKPIEVEIINARADGSRFWVQLSIVPVANEIGLYTHWVSVQRDISSRKEGESMVQKARLEIENKRLLEAQLQERERAEVYLTYKAFHDELTKLYNRAFMMKRLEDVFRDRLDLQDVNVSILFIDLDGFKGVNDSMGHQAGDSLLVALAKRIQDSVRDIDVLARIGGDEFAILLTGKNHEKSAIELAERVVAIIKEPVNIGGKDVFISGSVGIVSSNKSHFTPSDLLRDADAAMYSAKRSGKGQWRLFDLSMGNDASNMMSFHSVIKNAVKKKQFSLSYQPIVNLSNGSVLAVEALLRLKDDKLGDISPCIFIPVLENLGLISEVGCWMMNRACLDYLLWKKSSEVFTLILSVNISAEELKYAGYADQVSSILSATGFESEFLQIEVTESAFLKESDLITSNLNKIRSLGGRVVLDNFGAGYSSISHIEKYPIDLVKIDSAFFSGMMVSDRSAAIVKCLIDLCSVLGMDIIAEGVQSSAQLAKIYSLGCYFQQGCHIGKPLESKDVIGFLNSFCMRGK